MQLWLNIGGLQDVGIIIAIGEVAAIGKMVISGKMVITGKINAMARMVKVGSIGSSMVR